MSKTLLVIIGVAIIVMGIWALIPAWQISDVNDPSWHAIVKIIVGLIAVYVGATDSGK